MPRKAHKEHQLQPGLSRTEKEQERYKKHPRIYVLEVGRFGCTAAVDFVAAALYLMLR